ncbi:hypothetical protein DI005_20210 [Prauserella sp. PE36]|uniref:hypothetical protein n=1 Tax=Prauserella sp. PE36 TaxID=1504709 RepID=UPI000DE545DE|nr:hypothetical protein [Prauserella sp. PE36]RBM18119.1 hypothetical protein DI005_20210 [Prauserella sp. PE36]
MSRRTIWITVVAVAVLAVLGAGFWVGYQQAAEDDHGTNVVNHVGAEPEQGPRRGEPVPPRPSAAARPQPETVARQWLAGQHTLYAHDPRPDAWIARVENLATDQMRAGLAQFRDGNGGVVWENFQRQRCTRTVRDLHAEQAPGAPSTEDSRWLLVQGVAVTACELNPDTPPFPAETLVTATLELTREPSGEWLVNARTEAG